jgi:hypothetical protein
LRQVTQRRPRFWSRYFSTEAHRHENLYPSELVMALLKGLLFLITFARVGPLP